MEFTLFLDHQCNLRCTYCYTGHKFSRPMSREILGRAVDLALARAGSDLDIAFFGGEPLLHFGLMRETEACVSEALARSARPPTQRGWGRTIGCARESDGSARVGCRSWCWP
jgi:hypothetical protein